MNRLQEAYQNSVRKELANKFNYKSSMEIPKLEKIVINMGVGDAVANAKVLDDAVEEFLDKLVSIALPRVRDFRGVNGNAFDGRGNYTLGVKEQLIFPEINFDKVKKIRGMDIVIVTTAKSDEEGRTLLQLLGMPFRK